jgi:glycosyltransferase involved in cell wall biosynthesis
MAIKISAVIACYRDGPAVPLMYQRLKAVFEKISVDYEIIFVNDRSPDNAAEILAELAAQDKKVVVINHTRNFGSQSAFTDGMRLATGDAVVLLDGDLQDPPELIEDFYNQWQAGYQVVYGVRVKREESPWMQVMYKTFYRIFRVFSYVPMPLDAGDFSLLDRRVVDAVNALPETNRFIRGLRTWVGYKQIGVSYVRPKRMFGRSTNNLIKNIAWARKGIFSFSYVPLELIGLLAFLTVITAFIYIVLQIGLRIFFPQMIPSGFTTLIILILFIGGVQLLCLSIIGGYLEQIYDEVKCRPPYVVDSILNRPDKHDQDEEDGS